MCVYAMYDIRVIMGELLLKHFVVRPDMTHFKS